jgi:hypothetical protein
MKKLALFIAFTILASLTLFSYPDEGMWLPLYIKQLNEKKMIEMGLKLTADDIYSINHASLKDAVVRLGDGFCTGEIVSGQGLVFTNHHCGYDAIAELSTLSNNFLQDGFWAMTMKDEIPVPNLTISRLVYMKDLTKEIDSLTSGYKDDFEKSRKINSIGDSIVSAAIAGTHYKAEVTTMFEGSEYYLMVYETFRDIRFVGAPPSSIGKFGGDTDNWMWPRQTGDFSMLRIYVGKDGNPADYSTDNVPYTPLKFLEISLKGLKDGDFSMIMGYPGTTARYLSSYDIDFKLNVEQPAIIDIFGGMLKTMKEDMDANPQLKLNVASDYASSMNSYKYYEGQWLGLKKFDLSGIYREKEKGFIDWANATEARKDEFGSVLSNLESEYVKYRRITPGYYYITYGLFRLDLLGLAYGLNMLNDQYMSGKKTEQLTADINDLKKESDKSFAKLIIPTDAKVMMLLLLKFHDKLDDPLQFPIFKMIEDKYKGNNFKEKFELYYKDLTKKSIVFDKAKMDKFFAKPSASVLKKDMTVELVNAIMEFYQNNYRTINRSVNSKLDAAHKQYIIGLRQYQKDKTFYPDANSTLRLTYGKVASYYPRDAVFYNYKTTQFGILEKEDNSNEEFLVPPKLHDLFVKKDFGRYGVGDSLFTCFLTTNDITGGNSGSPVLDAYGRLVGLAFDGNWEAMTGDLMINPKLNRTINVDIRYVLFVIDKFGGCTRLIDELRIVEN